MTLDSLKDPANIVDQQSEAVAQGYFDLANVINAQNNGDKVKSEMLVRESLRIRSHLHDPHHQLVGASSGLLASILKAQGKLGSETKELYDRALAIDIKNYGPERVETAISNTNQGNFYLLRASSQTVGLRRNDLQQSEFKYKEALRIFTERYGPDNPRTIKASSQLSLITQLLSKA